VKRREKLSGPTLRAFDRALEWASHISQSAENGRIEDGDPFTALYQRAGAGAANRMTIGIACAVVGLSA
jgi:hypothetical protein